MGLEKLRIRIDTNESKLFDILQYTIINKF